MEESRRILILLAHPALEKSKVNRLLLEHVSDVAGVTVHDLYEQYPDFDLDVRHEQTLLEEHDVVIFQHPLYWYSTPALLKQWQDSVLEHGWAYGSDGRALEGKVLFNAVSTGGGLDAYRPEGFHGTTLLELLAPIRQTARLCRMRYLPPFVSDGAFRRHAAEIRIMAQEYRALLEALREQKVDLVRAEGLGVLNNWVPLLPESRGASEERSEVDPQASEEAH